jgi:hypothetical protein
MLNLKARNLLIEEYPLAERYLTPIKQNQFIYRLQWPNMKGRPGLLSAWQRIFILKETADLKILLAKNKNMVALHETRSRSNDI